MIIESTHATMANVIQARLEQAGYPLSLPGSWAVLLGTLVRTGQDVSSADAVQAIARLDERPVLIVTGGQDETIRCKTPMTCWPPPRRPGRRRELDVCEEAGHAESLEACPEDYPGWMLGFLERVLAPAG